MDTLSLALWLLLIGLAAVAFASCRAMRHACEETMREVAREEAREENRALCRVLQRRLERIERRLPGPRPGTPMVNLYEIDEEVS